MLDYKCAIQMMVRIRETEWFIRNAFWDHKIFSFLHLSLGQEATAVGVASALSKDDLMLGNHRSHGHYLAKGGNIEKMVYEIFGDERGCCKGYGGSMHMLDRSVGFVGSTPILGSIAPIAVGHAFSSKLNCKNNNTVVFLGDGSAEEGVFLESINLAANKECKIIFAIEDNRYAVNSGHMARKSTYYDFQSLFTGLGAVYLECNGQSITDVYEKAARAVKETQNNRPVVLKLNTLRQHTHSGPIIETTDADYRDGDTIEYRERNDCINLAINEAVSKGYKSNELNDLIEITKTETKNELDKIFSTIRVRSLD